MSSFEEVKFLFRTQPMCCMDIFSCKYIFFIRKLLLILSANTITAFMFVKRLFSVRPIKVHCTYLQGFYKLGQIRKSCSYSTRICKLISLVITLPLRNSSCSNLDVMHRLGFRPWLLQGQFLKNQSDYESERFLITFAILRHAHAISYCHYSLQAFLVLYSK